MGLKEKEVASVRLPEWLINHAIPADKIEKAVCGQKWISN
jgi:hypothetical protein